MASSISLSQKQRADVGDVALESAVLERTVDVVLASLTKLSSFEYGELVGMRMVDKKLDLASCLAKRKPRTQTAKTTFQALIEKLKALNGERNIVMAHGSRREAFGLRIS